MFRCLFCGSKENPSHEHVLADWLKGAMPFFTAKWRVHQSYEPVGGERQVRVMEFSPFTQTVKGVCEPCNTRWMSNLENANKPLLTPLLEGRGKHFGPDSQRLLSSWALKTSMVWQETLPRDTIRGIPPEHFRWLYEHRDTGTIAPPPGTLVWIGAYGEQRGPPTAVHVPLRIEYSDDPLPPNEANAYSVTFSIGHVAFQIFGTTFEGQGLPKAPGKHDLILHQIWPFDSPVIWPPDRLLTAQMLRGLAEMWTN